MTKLIIVFLGFSAVILSSCKEDRPSVKPIYDELVVAVYSSVEVQPKEIYKVNATVGGVLTHVYVEEGDEVDKNGDLFIIDMQQAKLTERNAELNYNLIKESLMGQSSLIEDMKLELNNAKNKFINDSVHYQRYKELYKNEAVSKTEMENVRLMFLTSKNTYNGLKNRLNRKEIELKNQLEQARVNVQQSKLRGNDFKISSLMDGIVYQVNKEKGETVNVQEPLAIIGSKNNFVLKMLIDESDISKVFIDQKVIVSLEAFPGKIFNAKISKISPRMNPLNQTFEIEAYFVNPPNNLYMGLTGEGNIIVHEKKKTLVIPREYLMAGNKVETSDGQVSVKTGMSNWDYIEILSGIDNKTVIYKPE